GTEAAGSFLKVQEAISGQCACVGIFFETSSVVSADGGLLGQQRQTRIHAPAAACKIDARLGERTAIGSTDTQSKTGDCNKQCKKRRKTFEGLGPIGCSAGVF